MKQLFYFLICLFFTVPVYAQHKNRVSFNSDWRFKLDSLESYHDESMTDESWTALDLPHDWSIEGNFSREHPAGTGGGALPGGIGWYLKTFTIPSHQKHKRIYIEFDGVYRNSEVYVNGNLVGKRPNGYISFQYEITRFLNYESEPNNIVVKVDNSRQPNSRWYSGSGIYRNVWLTTVEPIHIAHWGTFITTPVVTEKNATIHTRFTIVNNKGGKKKVRVTQKIVSLSGNKDTISSHQDLEMTDPSFENDFKIQITNPALWSVGQPRLYKSIITISEGDFVLDEYETVFGIRRFWFDADKGFFLNGKPLKILGVCNHHDLGALGAAINTRALERQLELLKAMGCNGIRTSHNPPAPELLELADKMGFIVMDESYDMWKKSKTAFDYSLDWDQWHRKDLEDFVKRDRNHPSVFMWSVGNEIYEQWGDDSIGRVMSRELVSIVHALDTTRPVTTANNFVTPWNHLINSNAFELIGYNYHHKQWADFKKDHPGKKLVITESTSALATRGHYDLYPADSIRRWPEAWDKPFTGGNADLTISAYDHVSTPWGSTHEESVKILLKHNFISGMYIWTGFDYLGEPTPYPWPARSSYFGIIDLAGFPKDVYYMYQSVFTKKPVLHLLPHWNWKQGDTVDVVAYYNNANAVELFLNGKSLGKRSKQGDELHVSWRLPFAPGVVKAVSIKQGKKVLEKEIRTAGPAYRIILDADRKTINADGKDLSFITATIVDRNGVVVPNAKNLVKFQVNGGGFIAAVDSGDPVSLEPFKSDQHTALNGKVLCIVQSNGRTGKISISASAANLQTAAIEVSAK